MMSRAKKFLCTSAVVLALAIPAYGKSSTPAEHFSRTSFEKTNIVKYRPMDEAIFALPAGLGHAGALIASGLIQSIQTFSIALGSGVTSNTATVTSVTTANAFILWNGRSTDRNGNITNNQDEAGVVVTNATTLTATRATSNSNTVTVQGTLVELKSGKATSIQAGTITIAASGTTNTATVSAVTTTRAVVIFNGQTYNSATTNQNLAVAMMRLSVASSTSVSATRDTAGTQTATAYFVLVDWASGVLNSNTQEATITLVSVTSNTATISSVTTGNTLLVWGGHTSPQTGVNPAPDPKAVLTNGTTITASVNSAANAPTCMVTAIEFKSSDVQSKNSAATAMGAAETTTNVTVTAVVIAKTLLSCLGRNIGNSTGNAGTCNMAIAITTTTNIAITRGVASSNTATTSWEALELKA